MSDAEQLARLRVAVATGNLPRDLGAWAVEFIAGSLLDVRDVAARNERLRRAAGMLSGSRWARARLLEAALAGRAVVPAEVRALVAEAQRLDPACPTSMRQLVRLLAA